MSERRGRPRFQPEEALYGRVKMTLSARILDISTSGMRVEVGSALRPSAECDVAIPVAGRELRLRARVLRCRAQAGNPTETGSIVFRAGLEFVHLSEEAERALESSYGRRATAPAGKEPARTAGPIKIKVSVEDIARRRQQQGE